MQPEQNNDSATVIDNTPEVSMEHSGSTENIMAQDNSSSKKKKNAKTGIILGFILLFLLAAGGVGFGIWAMMDGNAQREKLDSQIGDLRRQNDELLTQMDGMAIDEEGVDVNNTVEDAWASYSSKLANQGMYIHGDYWHWNGTTNERFNSYAYKDANGHLTITDTVDGSEDNVILELDNVLAIYYTRLGDGSVPYYFIVNNDGGVSRFGMMDGYRKIEKVGDYNKIVTIAGEVEAILVDIDGNVYKVDQ